MDMAVEESWLDHRQRVLGADPQVGSMCSAGAVVIERKVPVAEGGGHGEKKKALPASMPGGLSVASAEALAITY
jgi:hypothetical protein